MSTKNKRWTSFDIEVLGDDDVVVRKASRRRPRWWWFWNDRVDRWALAAALMVVLMATSGTVQHVRSRRRPAGHDNPFAQRLQKLLLERNYNSGDDVTSFLSMSSSSSSPTQQAWEWILDEQNFGEKLSDEELLERFAVVTFLLGSKGNEDEEEEERHNNKKNRFFPFDLPKKRVHVCDWSDGERRCWRDGYNFGFVCGGGPGLEEEEDEMKKTPRFRLLLQEMDLTCTKLDHGRIPPEIRLLTNLRLLRMDNMGRLEQGNIPSQLGWLTSLTSLDLYSSNLSGSIPTEIGRMTQLEVLRLWFHYHSNVVGNIPTEIGRLTNLKTLVIALSSTRGRLDGNIPTEIGRMTALTRLNLFTYHLDGTIPSEIGRLTNLNKLIFVVDGAHLFSKRAVQDQRDWFGDDVEQKGEENQEPY